MKKLLAATLVVGALSQAGCAAIFTGTSQKVQIDTDPAGATVVVVGGTVGNMLIKAGKVSNLIQDIVDILEPHLPKDVVDVLRKLDVGELITVVVEAARDKVPSFLPEPVREAVAKLPKAIVRKAYNLIGIEEVASGPCRVELKKGRPYAVVAWMDGYTARVDSVSLSFNFVVVLNIFNLILPGTIIDVLTGAWMNLDDKIGIRLRKR